MVCTGASPTGWPVAGSKMVRLLSPGAGVILASK